LTAGVGVGGVELGAGVQLARSSIATTDTIAIAAAPVRIRPFMVAPDPRAHARAHAPLLLSGSV